MYLFIIPPPRHRLRLPCFRLSNFSFLAARQHVSEFHSVPSLNPNSFILKKFQFLVCAVCSWCINHGRGIKAKNLGDRGDLLEVLNAKQAVGGKEEQVAQGTLEKQVRDKGELDQGTYGAKAVGA